MSGVAVHHTLPHLSMQAAAAAAAAAAVDNEQQQQRAAQLLRQNFQVRSLERQLKASGLLINKLQKKQRMVRWSSLAG